MKNTKIHLFLFVSVAMLSMYTITGCNNDSVSTTQADNIDVSSMGSPDSTDTGLLIITQVKLLIKDIKLNVVASSEDSANFKVGPYIFNLDLTTNVNFVGSAYIPEGTYDKVRFMVHKLEDTEPIPDPDFADSLGRYSVVIRGTFAGVPFVYKSTKSAHQKLTFPGSLMVSNTGKSNITIRVKPYIWFIKNNTYLDPSNPANWNDIDNNIKDNINNNFKAYKDNNKDGQPD